MFLRYAKEWCLGPRAVTLVSGPTDPEPHNCLPRPADTCLASVNKRLGMLRMHGIDLISYALH